MAVREQKGHTRFAGVSQRRFRRGSEVNGAVKGASLYAAKKRS
jgi:hypothetical protein